MRKGEITSKGQILKLLRKKREKIHPEERKEDNMCCDPRLETVGKEGFI